MLPYARDGAAEGEDDGDEEFLCPAKGPCCCALLRYDMKLSGRESDGDAGWT